MIATVLASRATGIPISQFTRDPAAVMGAHPFLGVVSTVGVLAWAATATVCFFTSLLLRDRGRAPKVQAFFALGGAITLLLLVDDAFMLHDWVLPRYFELGEGVLFLVYGVLIAAYLVRYRASISMPSSQLLASALGFFALSLIVDRFPEGWLPGHHLFEDGLKLLGIVSWLTYFVAVSRAALGAPTQEATTDNP